MSPEQALGKRVTIDHRADIYALGVSLYELLTTEPAFDGENRAALLKQIMHAPQQHLRPEFDSRRMVRVRNGNIVGIVFHSFN